MNFSSKLIEEAVNQMGSLPGVGKRTALRYVMDLLKRNPEAVELFANAFTKLRNEIKFCKNCNNLSDHETCNICSNPNRDQHSICVVENIRDLMAVENTMQFKGLYHVLGGIISPIDGIGPSDINIASLVDRVSTGQFNEVVFALNSTIEAETTNFFIYKKIKDFDIKITNLSRGIAFGDELEYTDEISLGRSIANRIPYENSTIK